MQPSACLLEVQEGRGSDDNHNAVLAAHNRIKHLLYHRPKKHHSFQSKVWFPTVTNMSVKINKASTADETNNAMECIGAGKLKTAISFLATENKMEG